MNKLSSSIEFFGSQSNLARALGVAPNVVWNWKRRGIPIRMCIKIERISGGALSRRKLRPEIFGEED